jgi:short-subunit dehydrogenase
MSEFRGGGGWALVTGASRGIGLELARRFAERGLPVALAARSEEELRSLADRLARDHAVKTLVVPVDLAAAPGPSRLVDAIRATDLPVDVLVNNAGFATYGEFGRLGPDRERAMLQLNVTTPTELAARLLPAMRERRRGLIVNVASTAAWAPVPWLASYSASKAYLVSWTRALDLELRGTGVRACALCPGTTATSFQEVSGASATQRHRLPDQTAAAVADECLRGIDRGRRVIVTGALNRAHTAAASVLPADFAARLADVVMRPKR